MEYEEFKKILKENSLTVREFANLSGVGYATCSGWGRMDRKVSSWVYSWLTLYKENQEFKKYKEVVQTLMSVNNK